MSSNISIFCPYCRLLELSSPEVLCAHIEEEHQIDVPVMEKHFDTPEAFYRWLSSVEVARAEGGVLGADEAGPSTEDVEYYLLCRRKESPHMKRRRLLSPIAYRHFEQKAIVNCTAFVHVTETVDGGFNVTYCLEHCWSCDNVESRRNLDEPERSRKRMKNKRGSECLSDDGYAPTPSPQKSLSPPLRKLAEVPVAMEVEETNNNQLEKIGVEDIYDISSMNNIINQKLDSTADRLRVLTQVLAELAVDIRACEAK